MGTDTPQSSSLKRRLEVSDLLRMAIPEDPLPSPDGRQVVYVLRSFDGAGDCDLRSLWILSLDDGSAVPLTEGRNDVSPAWSPDGRYIVFVRRTENTSELVATDPVAKQELWATQLPYNLGTPSFSPDGSTVAVVGSERAESDPAAGVVWEDIGLRRDGAPRKPPPTEHLCLVGIEGQDVSYLALPTRQTTQPVWSADGSRIAVTGIGPGDRVPAPYVIDPNGLQAPVRVGPPQGRADTVSWLPDGISLMVSGQQTSMVGLTRLLLIQTQTGEVTSPFPELDLNVRCGAGPGYPGSPPSLTGDGQQVLFLGCDSGNNRPYLGDIDTGAVRPLIDGPAIHLSSATVAADARTAAIVLCTPDTYGEVATIELDTGRVQTWTQHTAATLGEVELFVPEPVTFEISDGGTVSGWMLGARHEDEPQRLLLDLHGGPHNTWTGVANPVHLYQQALAARGWVVLFLNPRGSDGYGEEFYRASIGAWGAADRNDQLEPIDQLVSAGVADPDRLAIVGFSYGAFTACGLISSDQRFAAACAGGLICDLASFVGTSDQGAWIGSEELGALPWEAPDMYSRLSPLSRAAAVTTPMLLLHGVDDARVPIGQADQWFFALRQQGVDVHLVDYPGANHLFAVTGRPSQRMDWSQRVVDWFEQRVGS